MARPTKKTPEVIRKIEEVAALDGTIAEMALYGGVHPDSIYAWMAEDKKFSDRIQELRNTPVLKARNTVNEKMTESYSNAMDYLKRKKKKEFGDNSTIEVTTPKPLLDALYNNNSDKKDTSAK